MAIKNIGAFAQPDPHEHVAKAHEKVIKALQSSLAEAKANPHPQYSEQKKIVRETQRDIDHHQAAADAARAGNVPSKRSRVASTYRNLGTKEYGGEAAEALHNLAGAHESYHAEKAKPAAPVHQQLAAAQTTEGPKGTSNRGAVTAASDAGAAAKASQASESAHGAGEAARETGSADLHQVAARAHASAANAAREAGDARGVAHHEKFAGIHGAAADEGPHANAMYASLAGTGRYMNTALHGGEAPRSQAEDSTHRSAVASDATGKALRTTGPDRMNEHNNAAAAHSVAAVQARAVGNEKLAQAHDNLADRHVAEAQRGDWTGPKTMSADYGGADLEAIKEHVVGPARARPTVQQLTGDSASKEVAGNSRAAEHHEKHAALENEWAQKAERSGQQGKADAHVARAAYHTEAALAFRASQETAMKPEHQAQIRPGSTPYSLHNAAAELHAHAAGMTNDEGQRRVHQLNVEAHEKARRVAKALKPQEQAAHDADLAKHGEGRERGSKAAAKKEYTPAPVQTGKRGGRFVLSSRGLKAYVGKKA